MRILTLLLALALAAPGQNKKIVVTGMPADAIAEFQRVSGKVTVVVAEPMPKMIEQVADADAIFGAINPDLFRAAKRLKWVQVYSAGVETYRFPEFLHSQVTLTNCKILQGPNIADHALSMLLALTRELHLLIPDRTKEEWNKTRWKPIELRGKTAVILGVGGIGSQIAQRAHAFGMRVIGVDPKEMPLNPYVSRMVFPDRLDSVLPEADVVFISAPHTPQSENMMGPKQFELLKKGVYFIAVSRGKLYSTDALVKALDSKRLAGAGLDVTNPEPLPKGHPLWKFENVIITPHIAGQSDGVQARRMELIKENIARFVSGEPMLNVVDKVKGY
ncbi:MAG: D-2-hydroxyacid dehydrogenase [Acidobacteria bacterium]|nr:D-2-hydroxyacid dehydrogenase [Acidobacteriota bacterium]